MATSARGHVRLWHAEDGWGVIDSAATPGGCWAHFSALLVPDYRALEAGNAVEFTFAAAQQDGYAFRAVEVWPADQPPVWTRQEVVGSSPAYRSHLTLWFEAGFDAAWAEAVCARVSVEGWNLDDQVVDLTGDGSRDGARAGRVVRPDPAGSRFLRP